MKEIILNCTITLLIIMNIFVGAMIYTGLQPRCFVDGCMCVRIKGDHYCRRHSYLNTNTATDAVAVCVQDDMVCTITYNATGKEIWLKAKNKN